MQKHYWQIMIDGNPWQNQKIWNIGSAKAVYEKVKNDLEKHVDYKGEIIEIVRIEGKYAIVEED